MLQERQNNRQIDEILSNYLRQKDIADIYGTTHSAVVHRLQRNKAPYIELMGVKLFHKDVVQSIYES